MITVDQAMLQIRERALAITGLERRFTVVRDCLDEQPGIDRVHDLSGRVWATFCVVGVEDRICRSGADLGQLPREVFCVAHAAAHALSIERRHLVGGIARQEDRTLSKSLGNGRVESIHGCAVDLKLRWRSPARQQSRYRIFSQHLISRLTGLELELPTPTRAETRNQRGDPRWITVLTCKAR